MKTALGTLVLSAALVVSSGAALAQTGTQQGTGAATNPAGNSEVQANNPNTFTQEEGGRIVQEVRSKLLKLNDYGIFDSLGFGIRGRTIILTGFASRPQLKSEAGRSIKEIKGIEGVDNQIKVLPYSPNDDRIRIEVYRRVYGQPQLRKYTSAPVGFGRMPSVALAAGGITQDPPLGYHAIHIIVDNGHVTLTGVVDSKSDADVATIQANSAPGAFSVTNDIQIAGRPAAEK
jgi:hyperosmotically inducible protein